MRTVSLYLATLVSVLGIATASQAAIQIDFEIGGSTNVAAAGSSSVTVDIYMTATGTTAVSGYQFSILFHVNDVRDGSSLVNSPTHAGAGSWTSGGAGLVLQSNAPPYRSYNAAISASTLTDGDEITAADGKVLIGSLTFHVFSAVSDNGIDVTGCFNCSAFGSTGDGLIGSVAGGSQPINLGLVTFEGVSIIPEPTTASLLGLGLVGIAASRRRRAAGAR